MRARKYDFMIQLRVKEIEQSAKPDYSGAQVVVRTPLTGPVLNL